MKCPHCGYEYGYSPDKREYVNGQHGDFFTLPIKVERTEHGETQSRTVYACPAPECGILFNW